VHPVHLVNLVHPVHLVNLVHPVHLVNPVHLVQAAAIRHEWPSGSRT
jgi:hypothetical protein